ncbi:MAG TPA: Fic family protein, partial [Ignavibacteria bacterium]|nr:Fic family protein [Ignavibacteria bacterium]
MYLDKIIQQRLDEKLEALAELRPVQTSLLKKLKHQIALEMTYNSNAIEGNTLDLKETFLVISEGITIKGKSMKEHLEAKDHYEAIEYLNELVSEETKNSFTEVTLRSLHQLIMRETYSEEAGKYRTGN